MDMLTPPEPLNLEGNNLADTWRKWKQCFKVFSLACGLSKKEEKVQAATLLHVTRSEALDIGNTLIWEAKGNDKKVSKILEKFEACCIPRKNVTWQRHFSIRVTNTRTILLTSISPTLKLKPNRVNFMILKMV